MANGKSQLLKQVWRFLARLDLAATLIFAMLLLAALGSCFPQLSPLIAADPERLAQWETVVRGKYGALADLLFSSGVFRCFRSPVFLAFLALLALATLVCTVERWLKVWRQAFHQPVRCSDLALDTAPHTAALTAPEADLRRAVRESLRERGFRVRVETDGDVVYLRGDRNRLAPLGTLVTHLAVVVLLLGAALSSAYGWRAEVTTDPGEVVEVGHGTDLALRNDGFAIVRYPDGSSAGYEAEIAIIEKGHEIRHGTARVNEPLAHGGVAFVLQSYEGEEGRYSVTLLAVHDPGYGPVVAAGFLLLFGLTVSFNFPHCWVHARIEPGGTLRLAGRADRRAWGFGREFEALVEGIGGSGNR